MKRTATLYVRIFRTYFKWAPSLLLLGAIVFVPLGLVDALTIHADLGSLDVSGSLQIAAIVGAVAALTVTGLVGEVFYSGAVAVYLTHFSHGRPPSLREISRRLNYGRLIAVDLIYGLVVVVGLVLLVAPGVLFFTWLGLAGPVVEIEGRGVRAAFVRSWHLVRGHFWMVFAVLVPIEVAGDGLTNVVAGLVHHTLGESLPATWLAESASNILLTPFYAVAAVLLTLELRAEKDALDQAPAEGPARA